MKYLDPHRQILLLSRPYWNRDDTRPVVRCAFRRTLECRTGELGATVYASADEEKIVNDTCKSPACTSCGYRNAVQWERERLAALPDVPYKGITFTMPKTLWPLFCENPHLTKALAELAATVIMAWARAKHGLRVGVMSILQTFNGRLEFNSHVHTLVTSGGLQGSGQWISSVFYHNDSLMKAWRNGILKLLRTALRAGQLRTQMTGDQVMRMLVQEERWWSVKIQSFRSTQHFLKYAGRYIRRPPIAQRRIIDVTSDSVTFWTKDKRLECRVLIKYSLAEFVDLWAQHILDRYQHSVRYFGLLAPRALSCTSAAIFAILGQEHRPRPKRIPWAVSIRRDFGWDPLLDSKGNRMKFVRRLPPVASR